MQAPINICSDLFESIMVDWNGDVGFCCRDYEKQIVIGNVNKTPLMEIWYGDKANHVRLCHLLGRKDSISPCNHCPGNNVHKTSSATIISYLKRIGRGDIINKLRQDGVI